MTTKLWNERSQDQKWRIMCNVYFKTQDGYDYMTHEADGELYETRYEAQKQREIYERESTQKDVEFFLEPVEVEA